jgi:hypothetical protein
MALGLNAFASWYLVFFVPLWRKRILIPKARNDKKNAATHSKLEATGNWPPANRQQMKHNRSASPP